MRLTDTSTLSPVRTTAGLPVSVWIALAAGVLSGSMAGILTRYAQAAGAASLPIAFTRLFLATIVVGIPTLIRYRAQLRAISRRDLLTTMFAGMWMATHFFLWVSSLEHVGVMIATVLVTSSPLWTAILEVTFLKARLTRVLMLGLAAVITGNILIGLAGGEGVSGSEPLLGAVLAISAALAIATQRVLSRGVRTRVHLLPFLSIMYASAAGTLFIAAVITGTPLTGYTPEAGFWIVMITIFPQLIGHSSFNYALRYIPATMISLAIQVEPVIATLAALVLFGEVPLLLQVFGSAFIVAGIIAVTRKNAPRPREESVLPPES